MTEAEAKTKWCPMYRSSTSDNRPWVWNPGGQPSGEISMRAAGCIGSACMAWRWAVMSHDGSSFQTCASKLRADLLSGENPNLITDAYCGLAGKP